jgi:cytochrome P450
MQATYIQPNQHTSQSMRCPVDHMALAQQKTARGTENGPKISRDTEGVWHVRGYEEAKTVLRSPDTTQAGFKAELLERAPSNMNPPILYQEGKAHHEQRKQTARFFAPKTVSDKYHQLMESLSEQIVTELQRTKHADLSDLSMVMAVRVAGQVVGLTGSLLPGLNRRLDAFFTNDLLPRGWSPRSIISLVRNQARIAAFFWLDVKPAINARCKQPREDVISHLLGRGATDAEILTECITYAAAGMVTTRALRRVW